MGNLATPFSAENQPANRGKRLPKRERYAAQIARANDLLAANLEVAAAAAVAIARGEAVEHLINHKTGTVHEIPVNPATRLKAVQFITERIEGKPDAQKTHELGDGAAGLFKVMLGRDAADHWGRVEAPEPVPLLEASFVPVEEAE